MDHETYDMVAARTFTVPLTGLNDYGSGPRTFATRTRGGAVFVRTEINRENFGERMTGRELCTLVPADHGLVIDGALVDAAVVTIWRERATVDIATDRAAAAARYGTVPDRYVPVPPASTDLASLLYSLAKEGVEFAGVVRFLGDEHRVSGDLPPELVDAAVAERARLIAPAVGAPLSIHLSPGNGTGDSSTNFDHEPAWDPAPAPEQWVEELERHPRTEPFIADWWLLRLRQAGAL
ncbi:hypothetical protein [Corynebacterium suedekumii]|uniref:Uncharacterized protein n=1 Tax=Corynebacterium suedekumii TaxID=3049801 RepID=A0ABY8VIJ1_9CORY|nr:hypothetical protein [Corynebacterium suedekumii]WIM69374.1 hypothetical protein QP029_08900 [Corynebacterium suedekumii]